MAPPVVARPAETRWQRTLQQPRMLEGAQALSAVLRVLVEFTLGSTVGLLLRLTQKFDGF